MGRSLTGSSPRGEGRPVLPAALRMQALGARARGGASGDVGDDRRRRSSGSHLRSLACIWGFVGVVLSCPLPTVRVCSSRFAGVGTDAQKA